MKRSAVMFGLCFSASAISHAASAAFNDDYVQAAVLKAGFKLSAAPTLQAAADIAPPNSVRALFNRTPPELKGLEGVYSERADKLLRINELTPGTFEYHASNRDPNSQALRKHLAEINLGYAFTPVPDVAQHYGFAALGHLDQGWSGAVDYFQQDGLGNCAFTEHHLALSRAKLSVDSKLANNQVNRKAATLQTEGDQESGYLYTVTWADQQFLRTLECANSKNAPELKAEMLALAQRIDRR